MESRKGYNSDELVDFIRVQLREKDVTYYKTMDQISSVRLRIAIFYSLKENALFLMDDLSWFGKFHQ